MKYIQMIIIASLFAFCASFSSNIFAKPVAAYRAQGQWHVIDENGKIIFSPQNIKEIGTFSEGYISARAIVNGKKIGIYYDETGKEVLRLNTETPFMVKNGIIRTVNNLDSMGKQRVYGYFNLKGEVVIPNDKKDALDFSEGLAYAATDDTRGYYNTEGKLVMPLIDLVGYKYSEGKAAVSNADMNFGFIDKKGKLIVPYKYSEVKSFSQGLCGAFIDGKFGFIDSVGNLKIDSKFQEVKNFSFDRAFVGIFDKDYNIIWCIINTDGKKICEFKYVYAEPFSEELAMVRNERNYGFVDVNDSTIVPFNYLTASSFKDGIAFVVRASDMKAGFINKHAEFLFDVPKFELLVDLRTNNRIKWPSN